MNFVLILLKFSDFGDDGRPKASRDDQRRPEQSRPRNTAKATTRGYQRRADQRRQQASRDDHRRPEPNRETRGNQRRPQRPETIRESRGTREHCQRRPQKSKGVGERRTFPKLGMCFWQKFVDLLCLRLQIEYIFLWSFLQNWLCRCSFQGPVHLTANLYFRRFREPRLPTKETYSM